MQQSPAPTSLPRSFNLALVIAAALWIVAAGNLASRSAQGIINRLNLPVFDQLLQQAFFLFLLLWGFTVIRWLATRRVSDLRSTNALPSRPTMAQEWQRGAALGWGMLLAAIIPMMLAGDLHPQISPELRNWGSAALSLAAIALSTLALEVALRGFLFQRLIAATSPGIAAALLSVFCGMISGFESNATSRSMVVTFLLTLIFSLAYLRTRALWLGWGLHFAWNASMAVLFGLPIAGNATYNDLIFTSVSGSDWLTGGPYGPQGGLLTVVVLLAGIVVLYRISRDYAWEYTHEPIIPAGYPMDIAPPAAHVAMENAAAAAPVPLVQIAGVTPTAASTVPVIDEHLRRDSGDAAP